MRRVLATFRPARFVLTMFGDDSAIDLLARLPTDHRAYADIDNLSGVYQRSSATCTSLESQRQQCVMACYSYNPVNPLALPAQAPLVVPVAAPLQLKHQQLQEHCKQQARCGVDEEVLLCTEDDEEQKEVEFTSSAQAVRA